MSDKPSLYVVEKREVVILVVLFVLVTVLAFTMGVRYGESVGKKSAQEQAVAENEHAAESPTVGGTLGGSHGEAAAKNEDHQENPKEGHAKADEHGKAEHEEDHGKTEHEEKGTRPEAAAKAASDDATPPSKEAADKNSDESLLNALKEAGVEPPGGKTLGNAKLPVEAKEPKESREVKIPSGSYVIQVGSHPTRGEAESQVRQLAAKKVHAEILAPFKDRQGEWHRVVIGNFKSKREAEREANALKSRRSILSFFVWRLP